MARTDVALGSSSALERDARLVSANHAVSPGEIALGVVIGRTSEAFNFFVFGIASVLVFPSLVFPFVDALTGTIYAFAIFSLGFIARPIGTVVFMAVDRRHGRGVKLTMALFILGSSTVAISFLPGYAEIGWPAIAILAVCRMGQGFALGGAWDGLASLLALNAPKQHRGWYAMIPQLGQPFGFIVASGLFAFFELNLSPEDFLSWGWRYPFFVAFTINVVALFARLRLIATKEFAESLASSDLAPSPVVELVRKHSFDLVIGALVPLASFALFHLVTIFPLSYVGLFGDRTPGAFLVLQLAGAIVGAVAVAISGVVADRVGRRTLLGSCAVAIAVFSLFTPLMLGGGITGQTIFIFVGFALLGLSLGQAAGTIASNFSNRDRYTGSALTTDLAWLSGAGFAPLVALGGYHRFGLWAVAAYLLSGALCTLAALAINRRMDRKIA